MIEVHNVSKRYGDVMALNQVSFTAQKGEVIGFLGANGAGKTTTMDILCGCTGADGGTVQVGGFEVSEHPIEVKKRLGYLPDEPPIHNDMRVGEYIDYAANLRRVPRAELKKRVGEMIERLDLGSVKDRLIGNLSKGFRQRVGLAQALIHNPDVLILDEPTEGLDPSQIAQIRDMITSFKGEHTIIYSSHILSEVETICDKLIIIDKGNIVEQGSYRELLSRLESGHRYAITVAEGAENLLPKIRALPEVQSAELSKDSHQTVEFAVQGEESIVEAVAKLAIEGRHGLRELAQRSKSLEDIYFQLTQKT